MPLGLEYLPKGLKQVVPVRLFLRIRRKFLGVAGAKILLGLLMSKSVQMSDKRRVKGKLRKKIGRLQAMIRALRKCARGHHLKPDFLLLFKHTYKIGGLG